MLNHVPYEKLVERKGLSFHKLRKRNDRWTTTTTTTRTRQIDRDARQPDHAGYHLWQDTYAWAVRAGKLVNRRWHRPWDVY